MEIIRKANVLCNILDEKDLLLLENHSLKKQYKINYVSRTNVTKLMLLITFLDKYPQISNIIEQYVKENPGEINKRCGYYTALDICIIHGAPNTKTIKILLENGTNINEQDSLGYTSYYVAYVYFSKPVMRLILEYDGINIKNYSGDYQDGYHSNKQNSKIKKISKSITLLNKKN